MGSTRQTRRVTFTGLVGVWTLLVAAVVTPLQLAGLGPATTALLAGLPWLVVLGRGVIPRASWRIASPLLILAAWGVAVGAAEGTIGAPAVQSLMCLAVLSGSIVLGSIVARVDGHRIGRHFDRAMKVAAVVSIGVIVLMAAHKLPYGPRGPAALLLVVLAWLLAGRRTHGVDVRWLVAVGGAIAVSNSRTALLVALVLFVASTPARTVAERARLIVAVIVVAAAANFAVHHWQPLRSHFFEGDTSLSVGGVSINGNGRTFLWGHVITSWRTAQVTGHGPGSADALVSHIERHTTLPHNDYLRILHDYGLVGAAIFLLFAARVGRYLRKAVHRYPAADVTDRRFDVAATLACLAMVGMMATDNVLVYPFFLAPLGLLVGLSVGGRYSPHVT